MQNRYKIYPDLHFGISRLSPGRKSFEELLDLAERFRKEKDFPEVHYQLSDLRGCMFDFDKDRLADMKSLIENYQSIDNQKLGVYLVDRPVETAYTMIFFKSINYKRDFCSTIEKAYKLLSLPISYEKFEKLIDI